MTSMTKETVAKRRMPLRKKCFPTSKRRGEDHPEEGEKHRPVNRKREEIRDKEIP